MVAYILLNYYYYTILKPIKNLVNPNPRPPRPLDLAPLDLNPNPTTRI